LDTTPGHAQQPGRHLGHVRGRHGPAHHGRGQVLQAHTQLQPDPAARPGAAAQAGLNT